MKTNQWFPEAALATVFWSVIAINNNLPLQFSSYADILSGFVLVVFIQFLYQANPPENYRSYLWLAYATLAVVFVFFAEASVTIAASGYLVFLSLSFIFRTLINK
jgi:membrane-associated HD superfamily phosphohydrolase